MLAIATPARTQPLEIVLHRGPAMGGPRLIGLGGAFAGMGDDANAVVANPAGLFAIPRSLDASLAIGNTDGEPFVTAVAFHLNDRFSLGVYASGSESRRRVTSSPPPQPPTEPPIEALFTGAAGREWATGTGMAIRLSRRFGVGGGIALHSLNFRPEEEGRSDRTLGYTVGIFFRPEQLHGARAGVVYNTPRSWKPNAAGGVADPVEIRTPTTWSMGISWRYDGWFGGRVVYTLQPDLVRYSELRLSTGQRGNDDLDLAAGVELSYPLARDKCYSGCGDMIQFRAGVISRSAGPAVVQLGRRTSWTAGVAWAPHWALPFGKFRMEAGYRHETRAFSLGIGIRYPEAYRAELEASR